MIRRLARDESGITMGLTVIMIVLIGVMGAGLLDANVFHYDGDTTTGGGESPWSCVSDANNVCTSNSAKVIDLGAQANRGRQLLGDRRWFGARCRFARRSHA
jgi:hypothetical protein